MQKNNWNDDFTQIVERFYNQDLVVSDVTKYQLEAIVDGVKRKRSPESRYQLEVNGIKNAAKNTLKKVKEQCPPNKAAANSQAGERKKERKKKNCNFILSKH